MFLSWVWPRSVTARSSRPLPVLGETDRPGLANAFEPGGDIDPIAHQIAVGLFDDIAEMNADTELDAALGRHTGIAKRRRIASRPHPFEVETQEKSVMFPRTALRVWLANSGVSSWCRL